MVDEACTFSRVPPSANATSVVASFVVHWFCFEDTPTRSCFHRLSMGLDYPVFLLHTPIDRRWEAINPRNFCPAHWIC